MIGYILTTLQIRVGTARCAVRAAERRKGRVMDALNADQHVSRNIPRQFQSVPPRTEGREARGGDIAARCPYQSATSRGAL